MSWSRRTGDGVTVEGYEFCAELVLTPSLALAIPLQNEVSSTWSELTHTVGPLPSIWKRQLAPGAPYIPIPGTGLGRPPKLAWLLSKAFGNKASTHPDRPLTQRVARDGLQLLILLP